MTKTEAQIREETIRECIEALPKEHFDARNEAWENGIAWHLRESISALKALLPKPDPVEALVNEWWDGGNRPGTGFADKRGVAFSFARWLISTGRLKP